MYYTCGWGPHVNSNFHWNSYYLHIWISTNSATVSQLLFGCGVQRSSMFHTERGGELTVRSHYLFFKNVYRPCVLRNQGLLVIWIFMNHSKTSKNDMINRNFLLSFTWSVETKRKETVDSLSYWIRPAILYFILLY